MKYSGVLEEDESCVCCFRMAVNISQEPAQLYRNQAKHAMGALRKRSNEGRHSDLVITIIAILFLLF